MIVEFIGCSGAGKTTLMHAVRECVSVPDSVVTAWDLVIDRPGRRWVTNQPAINLIADATALVPFARCYRSNREFFSFALRRLMAHAPSTFAKLNYTRNVIRKVGIHELAKRRAIDRTVLVDEGTVLIAYQLFVYSPAPYSPADVEQFARLVPAPDLLVHVKAPLPTLANRSMSRSDQRRELKGRDRQQVREFIERADELFDALAATDALRDRVLVVENPDGSPEVRRLVAQRIATGIEGFKGPGS